MDIRYIQELHDKIKEYKQNKKKYTDKKVLAVYVLKTLQMYSTEELPLSYRPNQINISINHPTPSFITYIASETNRLC